LIKSTKRNVVQAILFVARYIVVPFLSCFGLALILYGIVLGFGDYNKFWHIVEGVFALAFSYLILFVLNKRAKKT
jgi:uncharacterized membrane protein YqhA